MLCASQTVEWKRREGPATSIPLMESSDCPWGLWVTGWISGVRDRVTMRRAGKTASSRLFHNLAPVCVVDLRLRPGAFWGDWTRQWTLLSCWFNDFLAGLDKIQLHKNCMKKWFTGNNRLWHYMIQSNDHPGWPCQNLISRLWQEYSLSLGGQPSHHKLWPLHVHYWHKKWHYKWSLWSSDPFDPLERAWYAWKVYTTWPGGGSQ